MSTIIDTIAAHNRELVEEKKKKVSADEMQRRALDLPKDTHFLFREKLKEPGISFICEVKKASPSKGLIAKDFPYVEIAREYEAAGASAISCLTEPKWFLGKDEYLTEIAEAVTLPVLRKDFIIDPYMIYEAKVLGASAVLLIVSLLSREELKEWRQIAEDLGMDALVEAYNEEELDMAVESGARIVGVNNRDLKDFSVDTAHAASLRAQVPKEVLFVSESGISTRADVAALEEDGTDAVLIGETLMRAKDKKKKLNTLRGEST